MARHKMMSCRTFELKVDKSHLAEETLQALRLVFLEAKWFYNDLLARSRMGEQDIFHLRAGTDVVDDEVPMARCGESIDDHADMRNVSA